MLGRLLRSLRESGVRRTLNALSNRLERALGRTRLRSRPLAVDLEVTSRCPLACSHCPRTHREALALPFPVQDMDLATARTALRKLEGVRRITLQGFGEPLVAGHLFELVAEARSLGMHTSFSTSASVLTERMLEGFRTHPPHHLSFSCDTVDMRYDEGVRKNLDLGKFRSNVERILAAVRAADQGTTLLFHTCLVGENHRLLDDIVRFAAAMEVPQLDISELNLSYLEHVRDQVLPADRAAALAAVRRAQALGHELGVVVGFTPQQERPADQGPCAYLWQHPYVDVQGRVTPCCARPFAGSFSLGNLAESDLESIWNGAPMRELRAQHLRGECPTLCRGCPYAPGGAAASEVHATPAGP